MEFSPTDEQLAIIDGVKADTTNLIIKALAGAAKTSTLVLIAKATPTVPTLAISFNKAIATEMKSRLPGNCESKTLNSVGHSAWGRFLGRRLVINSDKTYNLTKAAVDALSGEDKASMYEVFSDTMQAVRWGKSMGYVPDNNPSLQHVKRLMDDETFFANLDTEPTELQEEIIRAVTNKSITLAMSGECDFDDQILMPTVFPATFTSYPQILLDESQDLSELNHAMVKKLLKINRLIAVGDENQAIYGFRGAHANSMDLLQSAFSAKEYLLSISFRCPQNVVKEARWRAPHMQWPDWAKEGEVKRMKEWGIKDIPDNAAIVCRNNAPIFACALALLRNGRYPEIIGGDIAKTLIKILRDLGDASTPQEEVLNRIEQWKNAKLEKARNPSTILDQAQCLAVFARAGTNLSDAIGYAEGIFRQSGPIKLMTVHKSKGLEFENVFILDGHLMNLVNKESQDRNLMYVAQTRAKATLTYIDSEKFVDN